MTYETSILFSILFGSIIFPITLIWTNGWLESVGFEDPNHSQSIYLLAAICGYASNTVAGLKFQHKKNIFTAYFQKQNGAARNDDFTEMLKGMKELQSKSASQVNTDTHMMTDTTVNNTPNNKTQSDFAVQTPQQQ